MTANFNIHDQWLGDVMPQSGVLVALGRNTSDGQPAVPVIEANTRLAILHDTLGSGILYYNKSKLRLEMIPTGPRPSGAQAIVTSVLFDAYDNTGGQTTSATAATLNLDTVRINTHPEIFVLASSELQINMSGIYEFEHFFCANTTGATRVSHQIYLERQAPGGSFVKIDGSDAYNYTRTSATYDSCNRRILFGPVAPGEKFRVRYVQTASPAITNVNTLADAGGLIVRKLG